MIAGGGFPIMAQHILIDLVNALGSNEALVSQMAAATSPEEKAKVASEHGFPVTVQDLRFLRTAAERGKQPEALSDDDLNFISGGTMVEYGVNVAVAILAATDDVMHALTGRRK